MSVETEADRQRDKAQECVMDAVAALSEIVVKQCDGHDEWKPEYRAKLSDWFQRLLAIRDEMGE